MTKVEFVNSATESRYSEACRRSSDMKLLHFSNVRFFALKKRVNEAMPHLGTKSLGREKP
jgi:hypothetical protein